MINEDLDKTLTGPLVQFGQDNSISVFLENIDESTSNDTASLTGFNVPSTVEQADLSTSEFRQGFFQVDIRVPKSAGKPELNKWADKINAVFKTGETFTFNSICLLCVGFSTGPLFIEDGWARLPCTIDWETFTNRL